MRALYGPERRIRFRTHYFPFTEPSIEAYVSCHVCDGDGCTTCRHSGWIEVGGAGMVDPKLFEFVGDHFGISVEVVTTDGRQPIGNGIGPVLEARDVMAVLSNDPKAPADLRRRQNEVSRCRDGHARKLDDVPLPH